MTKALEALAHHEAGHAVVAHHFGRKLVSVWIDPETKDGGTRMVVGKAQEDGHFPEEEIMIALAGSRAEFRFDPERKSTSLAGLKDEGRISTLICEYLRAKHGQSADIDEEAIQIDNRLALETGSLLSQPEHWRAVEALAGALVKNLKIDGREAEDIIRSAS